MIYLSIPARLRDIVGFLIIIYRNSKLVVTAILILLVPNLQQ